VSKTTILWLVVGGVALWLLWPKRAGASSVDKTVSGTDPDKAGAKVTQKPPDTSVSPNMTKPQSGGTVANPSLAAGVDANKLYYEESLIPLTGIS
jgi:hypothetical protein